MSTSTGDFSRSAYLTGALVMTHLKTGDLGKSYTYLLDLVHYTKGDVKTDARELSEQIKLRMDMGITEVPDELIQKAEIIVHNVSPGSRKSSSSSSDNGASAADDGSSSSSSSDNDDDDNNGSDGDKSSKDDKNSDSKDDKKFELPFP